MLPNLNSGRRPAQPLPIVFPRDYLARQAGRQGCRSAQRAHRDLPIASTPDPFICHEAEAASSDVDTPRTPKIEAKGSTSHFEQSLELAVSMAKRLKDQGHLFTESEKALARQLQSLLVPTASMAPSSFRLTKKISLPTLPAVPLVDLGAGAQTSGDCAPISPTKSGGGKLAAKIQAIGRSPHLYKEVIATNENVATLTQFAVDCSSGAFNLAQLSATISAEMQNIAGVNNVNVWIRDENRPDVMIDIEHQRSEVTSTSNHPLNVARTFSGLTFPPNGSGGYLPLLAEEEFFGVITLPDADMQDIGQNRIPVINALASISALSLRTARHVNSLNRMTDKSKATLQMAQRVSNSRITEQEIVEMMMQSAKNLVDAQEAVFFFVDDSGQLLPAEKSATHVVLPQEGSIAHHVAQTGDKIACSSVEQDHRFKLERSPSGIAVENVLCLPVKFEEKMIGVAQMTNKLPRIVHGVAIPQQFSASDKTLFDVFSSFAAVSIQNCRQTRKLLQEKRKSEAILEQVTFLANCDIRDVNAVVQNVMKGAKTLLNADRSSLFLIDEERNELYSKVADKTGGKEIRFPSGKGIAGTVASTGKAEIIHDAYNDPRFNKDVDKQLGYRTKSILCEPICYQGNILAVAQLVNKLPSDDESDMSKSFEHCEFTHEDQEAFRAFAMFAGISLSNSRLLEFVIKAGEEAMQLHTNTLEPLTPRGSNSCTSLAELISPEEVQSIANSLVPKVGGDVFTRNFNLFAVRETDSKEAYNMGAQVATVLLTSNDFATKFNIPSQDVVHKFVIRCRKSYRQVPYHNFFHAVDALQTCYTYLYEGKAADFLTDLDCYVLLVAALCHDLDHMGLNNNFHLKTDSPLGILSSASGNKSVLEVHHCNLAIEILQNPSSAMFAGLSSQDSTYAYRLLIDTILATDMARHGELMTKFDQVCEAGYDKANPDHRFLLCQILMKSADISNVTKPFEISRLWAIAVTEEFYQQGDKERAKGIDVMPMFDRTLGAELAKGQLGFINFLAKKFFELVALKLCRGMQWTVDQISSNTARWQEQLANH